ncbi:MAG: hypothetical protein IIW96_07145 [Oscillibacter sp.]|nr:hypothetical protein [Oscillibacter sp.]
MRSLRENAKTLRQNRRKGVSLVIAMCASFLTCVAIFGVILSASAFMKATRNKLALERCRQLAVSFADVLRAELSNEDAEFFHYVEAVLEEKGISRTMAAQEEAYGTLIVSVEWKENFDAELPEGSFPYGETAAALEKIAEESLVPWVAFVLQTRAELEGENYTCTDPYLQLARFQPLFFVDGSPVYWAEGWFWDEEATLPMENETADIHYTYDFDRPIDLSFAPDWGEGGGL